MKKIFLLLVALVLLPKVYCQSNDEASVKRVLEKESATWRSGDSVGHAACWIIRPYTRILVSTADGNMIDIPPDMIVHPPAGMMGKGGTSVNSDYKMNVSGTNAWVSHKEISTATDGTKSYSYEFRILEKVNGEWKLVGQSIHMHKPK
jgi:hypothetical protein